MFRKIALLHRLLVVFAITLVVTLAVLQSVAFSEEYAESTIKVGAVLALTGPAQTWGEYSRRGLELALEEVNTLGGINGRNLELVIEDSQSKPAVAVTAYKKLVSVDKVPIVFGDVWAFLTNAMVPLTEQLPALLLSPTVVPNSIEEPTKRVFTMGVRIELARSAVDRFFKSNSEIKSVAIFCWDDPWGNAYLKVWKSSASANDAEVVFQSCVNDFGYDYRTDVARAISRKPDAFILAHHSERILKHLREFDFQVPVLSTSNMVEVFHNGTLNVELAEGVYFTDWVPHGTFQRKFRDRYDVAPILEAHNSYEIARAASKALSENLDNPEVALRQVNYQGVAGTVDFRESFSGNSGEASLMKIKGGKIVAVK
ncbi:MAG: ABC transporter substrate-binding protein [Bdellovibrionales bacterium]|nr:ABC transporter substrate-binding protein [Bdellovibrionales bacterium]